MKFKALVKKDQGRGKGLGFPTANFDLVWEMEDGIYIAQAQNLPALVFIGSNITFNEEVRHGEAYIFDFEDNLYDKEIEIEVIQKIRENQKFDSPEELVRQMQEDERVAREFFKNYNKNN